MHPAVRGQSEEEGECICPSTQWRRAPEWLEQAHINQLFPQNVLVLWDINSLNFSVCESSLIYIYKYMYIFICTHMEVSVCTHIHIYFFMHILLLLFCCFQTTWSLISRRPFFWISVRETSICFNAWKKFLVFCTYWKITQNSIS